MEVVKSSIKSHLLLVGIAGILIALIEVCSNHLTASFFLTKSGTQNHTVLRTSSKCKFESFCLQTAANRLYEKSHRACVEPGEPMLGSVGKDNFSDMNAL